MYVHAYDSVCVVCAQAENTLSFVSEVNVNSCRVGYMYNSQQDQSDSSHYYCCYAFLLKVRSNHVACDK